MNALKSLLPQSFLIADPEPMARDHTALTLHNCGVPHIDTVDGGGQAIYVLANAPQPVDCLIAEADMENGNGLQLLQAIRCGMARHVRADMCVILTAYSWKPEMLLAAKMLDVNAVVIKPAAADVLSRQVLAARKRTFPLDIQRYRSVDVG